MPSYEMSLMLRTMARPELKSTLKRVAESIFDKGGVLRKIENLGHRTLPYKTSSHDMVHRDASLFILKFDTSTEVVADLYEEYGRDVDIVRRRIYKTQTESNVHCSLEEELLPPAYRKDVKKMIEIGKTQQNPFTYRFKFNSGLDYYPFQK